MAPPESEFGLSSGFAPAADSWHQKEGGYTGFREVTSATKLSTYAAIYPELAFSAHYTAVFTLVSAIFGGREACSPAQRQPPQGRTFFRIARVCAGHVLGGGMGATRRGIGSALVGAAPSCIEPAGEVSAALVLTSGHPVTPALPRRVTPRGLTSRDITSGGARSGLTSRGRVTPPSGLTSGHRVVRTSRQIGGA